MFSTSAVWGVLRADGLRVVRDRFLVGIAVYILTLAVVMRWAIPWVGDELAKRWEFDLTPYYPLLVSHMVIQLAPFLFGIVGGFLLLESREERTLQAIMVSPFPLTVYLSVIGCVALVGATVLTLLETAIIGLARPPWMALFAAGAVGAVAGPALAVFVAAFAHNKVEAFAYMKFCGAAPLVASAAFFIPEPWQWLATIYPPYWASKAYWAAEAGATTWTLWVALGLVTSIIWLGLLVRHFLRVTQT